jgi:cytochrome c nitrite reductase small subunit
MPRSASAPPERPPTGGRNMLGARLYGLAPLWAWLALAALVGGVAGLGGFTFIYANGTSYLSNDPAACVNCHVMRDVYDGWNHGSHKAVAVCNDCHTPHDLLGKYTVKAFNGYRHSAAFTMGGFPEPIRIGAFDRGIAYQNCIRCHGDLVGGIGHAGEKDPVDCLRCHAGVGHEVEG